MNYYIKFLNDFLRLMKIREKKIFNEIYDFTNILTFLLPPLSKIASSLQKGMVPQHWKKNSYPSLKPLQSYI